MSTDGQDDGERDPAARVAVVDVVGRGRIGAGRSGSGRGSSAIIRLDDNGPRAKPRTEPGADPRRRARRVRGQGLRRGAGRGHRPPGRPQQAADLPPLRRASSGLYRAVMSRRRSRGGGEISSAPGPDARRAWPRSTSSPPTDPEWIRVLLWETLEPGQRRGDGRRRARRSRPAAADLEAGSRATASGWRGSRPSRPPVGSPPISIRTCCSCRCSGAALYPVLLPHVADLVCGEDTRTDAFAERYRAHLVASPTTSPPDPRRRLGSRPTVDGLHRATGEGGRHAAAGDEGGGGRGDRRRSRDGRSDHGGRRPSRLRNRRRGHHPLPVLGDRDLGHLHAERPADRLVPADQHRRLAGAALGDPERERGRHGTDDPEPGPRRWLVERDRHAARQSTASRPRRSTS